jgi:predicted nucleotidyltransferase component of viral defense system
VLLHRQFVEIFHLLFLRQLAQGQDRTRFTVKGGCNLRFFFRSIRYSEDLDLDVSNISTGTLKNKVDRILNAPALAIPLRAKGIEVVSISAPKQTETTQRWKMGLSIEGQSTTIRTKIEFSRRDGQSDEPLVEAIDGGLCRAYGLMAPVIQHHGGQTALMQKIRALIGRPETQARDVFDLHLLRSQLPTLPGLAPDLRGLGDKATERVLSLSYDDYLSQVVAYLVPEQGEAFADQTVWEAMQLEVVEMLQEMAR